MRFLSIFILSILLVFACSQKNQVVETGSQEEEETPLQEGAEVTEVQVQGSANKYTFSVTIKSPDTGCEQYADWWEVLSLDSILLYRRVLLHSHVSEQPFTRSGGPIAISPSQEVYIRAHMNNTGYGTKVMKGSPASGFTSTTLDSDFAKGLAQQEPLPVDCDF